VNPPKVIRHSQPSYLDRGPTRGNLRNSQSRADFIRQHNPNDYRGISRIGEGFRQRNRADIDTRSHVVNRYYGQPRFHDYYNGWYRHGFYGGYYYPVHSCLDIDIFFNYPMAYWLYADSYDQDYWDHYYDDWYANTPAPSHVDVFRFAGVFYPTDTLRDLAIDVSSLDQGVTLNFRQGMTFLVEELQLQISAQLGESVALGKNSIVIDHFQNLDNKAVAMEGFVDQDDVQIPFKAFISLTDVSQDQVFVPDAQDPQNDADQASLKQMNDKIVKLGGDPYSADQEPDVTNTTQVTGMQAVQTLN